MSSSSTHIEDRQSRFELKTLLETSPLLIESNDMEFVLNNLLLIAMGKLMVSRGVILMYQPDENNYVVRKSKGRSLPEEGTVIEFPEIEKAKDHSIIQSRSTDMRLPEILATQQEYTLFNLKTSYHHLGFLMLGTKGNDQSFTRRELDFVENLVMISSAAIANSHMFTELRRINRMLDRKIYELNTLFDLGKDFNMMVDRQEIVRIFKLALLGQMLVRKFFFFLEHQGKRNLVAANGLNSDLLKEDITYLFRLDEDVVEVDEQFKSRIPALEENGISVVIGLRLQHEKIALMGVGSKANGEPYSTSDYNFLRSLGNLALLSIQKTYLLEERIEKERMEEELNIAKKIQQGLFPNPIPKIEGIDLSAVNIPSRQVGGDYFDIALTPDSNYLLAIADVTGKGIPAALIMANLQAMLHLLIPIDLSLAEATSKINDIIYDNTPSDKFVTFFWGKYDSKSQKFRYVNAGHNAPLFLKSGTDKPVELDDGGLLLGVMPSEAPYMEGTAELSENDLLVLYTDGVTETMNSGGEEEYGKNRLIECIIKHRELTARDIQDAIISDIGRFSDHIQLDDITLIVIKVE